MHTLRHLLAPAAPAACLLFGLLAGPASAAPMLNLPLYQLSASHAIDALGGLGLEASALTYAQDRRSLFIVGDEGLGVVELSLSGQTLGSQAFNWAGTGSSNNDAEGLTYLGGGQLVVVDERPQIAYRFSFASGGAAIPLASMPSVALAGSAASVGNVGTEGISHDPRDGSFVTVKQDNPASLLAGSLSFAVGGGSSGMSVLHTGATSLFGLNSLSDVQTLASVNSLAGTAAADHLLVLSLDSRRLIEIDRGGAVHSSLDLSGLTSQAIEGVTVDEQGRIYLVAESSGANPSQLFVMSPVPEPATWGLMLGGMMLLGVTAVRARR